MRTHLCWHWCTTHPRNFTPGAPFTDMDLFPAWISNHMSSKMLGISNDMPSKVWDEITNPFPNFNGFNNVSMPEFKLNHVSKRGPICAPDCVFGVVRLFYHSGTGVQWRWDNHAIVQIKTPAIPLRRYNNKGKSLCQWTNMTIFLYLKW